MGNVVTSFLRVYRLGAGRFEPGEAESIIEQCVTELDEFGPDYGSYYIPLVADIAADRSYLDLQGHASFGSGFEEKHDPTRYDLWGRMHDTGRDHDSLWHGRPGEGLGTSSQVPVATVSTACE